MTVVTFTTDFGTVDGYVGAMKGVVLSLAPDAVLIDITHDVPRHDVAAGAFALAQAAPLFPAGTVHVAVVDPGVGSDRADVVVEAGGALFVGPDNGLLSLAARGPRVVHRIERAEFRREPVSPTFHGRDVFAQTAGRLAGGTAARETGPLLAAIQELAPGSTNEATTDLGVIVHVDAFGNLITSFKEDMLTAGSWRLSTDDGRATFALQAGRTYVDVGRGELLVYVGSTALVEIAVREGSAAAATGLRRGDLVRLERLSG
jgi:S-adenosyl-L-methionine hydrolase (adenosine-forming)